MRCLPARGPRGGGRRDRASGSTGRWAAFRSPKPLGVQAAPASAPIHGVAAASAAARRSSAGRRARRFVSVKSLDVMPAPSYHRQVILPELPPRGAVVNTTKPGSSMLVRSRSGSWSSRRSRAAASSVFDCRGAARRADARAAQPRRLRGDDLRPRGRVRPGRSTAWRATWAPARRSASAAARSTASRTTGSRRPGSWRSPLRASSGRVLHRDRRGRRRSAGRPPDLAGDRRGDAPPRADAGTGGVADVRPAERGADDAQATGGSALHGNVIHRSVRRHT